MTPKRQIDIIKENILKRIYKENIFGIGGQLSKHSRSAYGSLSCGCFATSHVGARAEPLNAALVCEGAV